MKGAWATVLVGLVLGAMPASGSGYDEFALGITANTRGEIDAAITRLTAALKSGELVPAYVRAAYAGRARAYVGKNMCKEAVQDLDALAALGPLDRPALLTRAVAKVCLKDAAGAQQDFDRSVAGRARSLDYWGFGRMLWHAGFFPEAHGALDQALGLADRKADHAAYVALWYAMVGEQVGKLDRQKLGDFADKLNGDWPMPLLKVFLGTLTVDEANRKAAARNPATAREQKCEADFYIAEWHLARGAPEAAKPLISSAVQNCPRAFVEYAAAVEEAKRLGLPALGESEK